MKKMKTKFMFVGEKSRIKKTVVELPLGYSGADGKRAVVNVPVKDENEALKVLDEYYRMNTGLDEQHLITIP
jgi:hypothetical protein